jgi:two-component system NtrC family sensor kinase
MEVLDPAVEALVAERDALKAALQRASERLAGIVAIEHELAAVPELDAVMRLVLERVQSLTNAEGASLTLFDEDELVVRAATGIAEVTLGMRLPVETTLAGAALATGQSILVDDAKLDARVNPELKRLCGVESIVCAPLAAGGGQLGVLNIANSAGGIPLGEDERQTLELVAVVLASAMSRAEELKARREQVEALARFRTIFEHAPIGIVRVDERGRPLEVNAAFERMLGHTAEELAAMRFQDYTHPDDVESNLLLFRELVEGKRDAYRLEKRSYRKDGELIWTAVTAARADGHDGSTHAVSMLEDITERKRSEAERAETHALLDSIVDHVPGLLWVKDAEEFRFARVSRSFCEMFGLAAESIVGLTDYDLIPEMADGFRRDDLDALAWGTAVDVGREELVNSRGETRVIDTIKVPILAPDGTPLYVLGYAEDITERVAAERERAVVQHRFDAMAESIDEAFWMADLGTGKVLYANPAFARIWGVTQEDALANAEIRVGSVHADDRAAFFEQWEALERAFELEYRIVQPGGELRWVRDRVFHLEDTSGRVVLGISRDVTERVLERERAREEAERREDERRMSQKLEAVGQLAAGIAHEINTPIQFVGDSVRFLSDSFGDLSRLVDEYRAGCSSLRDGAEPLAMVDRVAAAENEADLEYLLERVPQAFTRTFDGISRVATIVRAMKTFAHPDTHEQHPADLNEALQNTLIVATSEYKYVADTELELGDIPQVVCNLGDLNQVFLNLVVNAAHAIEEAVQGTDERGVIRVSTARKGEHVEIAISDTGCGIPEDIRTRIFDPFFTTKEVGRGTGQGLALARSTIVDRHGGSIAVESEVGEGTTFRIVLPIAGRESAAEERVAA